VTSCRIRAPFAPALMLAISAVLADSCGGGKDGGPTGPPAPVLTAVTVTVAPSTIQVGQSATASAAGLDQNGAQLSLGSVTWSTGAPDIATVSASGVVSGVSPGQTLVTAASGGKQGQQSLTVVPVPVAAVSVAPASASIVVDATQQLVATMRDAAGNVLPGRVVTWSSSDTTKAKVSSTGLVTAVAAGGVTITAASEGKTGTSSITVQPPPVASVTVTPSSDTLLLGQSQTLQATPRSAAGTALPGRTITWSSSDTTVAVVSAAGAVTGRKAGVVTITATSEGVAGSAQFTIGSNVPVVTISGPATATRTGWASSTPITVQVRDAFSRPVTRASLNWSLPASGGWLFPAATITAADGSANASWIAGTVAGVVTVTAIANGGSAQAVGTYAVSVLPTPQYNAINTYFDVSGGSSAAGFRVDVTPLSEPARTYYAAIQWNGGYMGIQRGGSLFDRQLQFSAWNNAAGDAAVIDSASSHLRCSVFGGEGTGVACSLSYPWQIGRSYRFETQFTPSTQGTLIDGWVTSLSDGTRTYVGRIRQAGALSQASFTTFVEDFAGNAPHCLANQLRSYRVASPQALLGGTWTVLPTAVVYPYAPTTACANVNFVVANGGLEISLGAPVPRNPSVPIPIVVQMP
jgi:uncharacterized protein YjdB